MHGFVPRLKRFSLLLAAATTLGLATVPSVNAQTQDEPVTTFTALPSYAHFLNKIRLGKSVTVAFLGGSITAGATTRPLVDPGNRYNFADYEREIDSWRAQVFHTLRSAFQSYPKQVTMVNAALSGSGSLVGAFRYETDVAVHKPDLLIIDFSVNDAGLANLSTTPTADCSIQRSLLSVIEQARAENPNIAILMAISPARNILADPSSPTAVARALTMDAAITFGIPYVDVTKDFYQRPLPPGITPDHLYLGDPLQFGNSAHPSPHGHDVYANAVISTLTGLFRFRGFWFEEPRIPLPSNLLPFPVTPRRYSPMDMPPTMGFTTAINQENWVKHPIFNGKDAMFVLESEVSMSYRFQGSAAGIWWEWTYGDQPIHGKYQLLLDGQDLGVFSSDPDPALGEQRLPRFQIIGEGLDTNMWHTIDLVIPREQPMLIPNVINLAMIGLYVDEG